MIQPPKAEEVEISTTEKEEIKPKNQEPDELEITKIVQEALEIPKDEKPYVKTEVNYESQEFGEEGHLDTDSPDKIVAFNFKPSQDDFTLKEAKSEEKEEVLTAKEQETKQEETHVLRELLAAASGNDIEIEFYFKGKLINQNQSIFDVF